MDCFGSRGPQEPLSRGWELRNDLESEGIQPVSISYSAPFQSSLWPPESPASPFPIYLSCTVLHLFPIMLRSSSAPASIPNRQATTIHGFASAYTFSSVWALLLIPQAQPRGHPHREAFLSHLPAPTGHAPSLPELPEGACPFINTQFLRTARHRARCRRNSGQQNTPRPRPLRIYSPHHTGPYIIRDCIRLFSPPKASRHSGRSVNASLCFHVSETLTEME